MHIKSHEMQLVMGREDTVYHNMKVFFILKMIVLLL